MKKYLFVFYFICICFVLQAENTLKGVLLRQSSGYEIGDTITLLGERDKNNKREFLIKKKEFPVFDRVKASKVQIIDSVQTIWEAAWFKHSALQINYFGWDTKTIKVLNSESHDIVDFLKTNDLIYKNEVITDYIQSLVLSIYPGYLHIYKDSMKLKTFVIVSTEDRIVSLANGVILIPTNYLATIKSEKLLVIDLCMHIGHIVLGHQVMNAESVSARPTFQDILNSPMVNYKMGLNEGTQNMQNTLKTLFLGLGDYVFLNEAVLATGNFFFIEQKAHVREIAKAYFYKYYVDNKDEKWFVWKMSELITLKGWYMFGNTEYTEAEEIIKRKVKVGMANEEDLLLMSKIIRNLYATENKMKEAVQYLLLAKEIGLNPVIEIEKELALIYERLHNTDNAKQAWIRYQIGLKELKKTGHDVSDELSRVNEILFGYSVL